jgi:hypothetical protein
MQRIALGLMVLITCLAVAAPAGADPVKTPIDEAPFTFVDESICGFPIEISGSQAGHVIRFFDRDGALTRVKVHGTEQLTLSANGQTVTVDPFPFNFHVLYDEGEVEHVYLSGLVFRLRLPDGSLFVSAGRVDFIEEGADFLIVPAVGHSGDVDALCRALSD